MTTAHLSEQDAGQAPTMFGKVQQAADVLSKAHGIFQAARWAAPHAMTGLRAAAAFLP